jgi:hypothetical protein
MVVVWYPVPPHFVVKSMTNTTWFKPGQVLEVGEVEKCCQLNNWKVTMLDNEIVQALLGFVGARVGGMVP